MSRSHRPLDPQVPPVGLARYGVLDVLVNTAARGDLTTGFVTETDGSWQAVFALNLEARQGSIVSVTSINARLPSPQVPAYSALKAALLNATKHVASEYADRVRANMVSPGLAATPLWLGEAGAAAQISATSGVPAADIAAEAAEGTPLKRFLEPEEVAAAMCFLASPKASGSTGADLGVDGGLIKTL